MEDLNIFTNIQKNKNKNKLLKSYLYSNDSSNDKKVIEDYVELIYINLNLLFNDSNYNNDNNIKVFIMYLVMIYLLLLNKVENDSSSSLSEDNIITLLNYIIDDIKDDIIKDNDKLNIIFKQESSLADFNNNKMNFDFDKVTSQFNSLSEDGNESSSQLPKTADVVYALPVPNESKKEKDEFISYLNNLKSIDNFYNSCDNEISEISEKIMRYLNEDVSFKQLCKENFEEFLNSFFKKLLETLYNDILNKITDKGTNDINDEKKKYEKIKQCLNEEKIKKLKKYFNLFNNNSNNDTLDCLDNFFVLIDKIIEKNSEKYNNVSDEENIKKLKTIINQYFNPSNESNTIKSICDNSSNINTALEEIEFIPPPPERQQSINDLFEKVFFENANKKLNDNSLKTISDFKTFLNTDIINKLNTDSELQNYKYTSTTITSDTELINKFSSFFKSFLEKLYQTLIKELKEYFEQLNYNPKIFKQIKKNIIDINQNYSQILKDLNKTAIQTQLSDIYYIIINKLFENSSEYSSEYNELNKCNLDQLINQLINLLINLFELINDFYYNDTSLNNHNEFKQEISFLLNSVFNKDEICNIDKNKNNIIIINKLIQKLLNKNHVLFNNAPRDNANISIFINDKPENMTLFTHTKDEKYILVDIVYTDTDCKKKYNGYYFIKDEKKYKLIFNFESFFNEYKKIDVSVSNRIHSVDDLVKNTTFTKDELIDIVEKAITNIKNISISEQFNKNTKFSITKTNNEIIYLFYQTSDEEYIKIVDFGNENTFDIKYVFKKKSNGNYCFIGNNEQDFYQKFQKEFKLQYSLENLEEIVNKIIKLYNDKYGKYTVNIRNFINEDGKKIYKEVEFKKVSNEDYYENEEFYKNFAEIFPRNVKDRANPYYYTKNEIDSIIKNYDDYHNLCTQDNNLKRIRDNTTFCLIFEKDDESELIVHKYDFSSKEYKAYTFTKNGQDEYYDKDNFFQIDGVRTLFFKQTIIYSLQDWEQNGNTYSKPRIISSVTTSSMPTVSSDIVFSPGYTGVSPGYTSYSPGYTSYSPGYTSVSPGYTSVSPYDIYGRYRMNGGNNNKNSNLIYLIIIIIFNDLITHSNNLNVVKKKYKDFFK